MRGTLVFLILHLILLTSHRGQPLPATPWRNDRWGVHLMAARWDRGMPPGYQQIWYLFPWTLPWHELHFIIPVLQAETSNPTTHPTAHRRALMGQNQGTDEAGLQDLKFMSFLWPCMERQKMSTAKGNPKGGRVFYLMFSTGFPSPALKHPSHTRLQIFTFPQELPDRPHPHSSGHWPGPLKVSVMRGRHYVWEVATKEWDIIISSQK